MQGPQQQWRIPGKMGSRVPRVELRRRIDDVIEPLLFIVAPAGFGKTSVLADWARTTSRDVVWFSCRPSDHDAREFWQRFVNGLTERWPSMGNDAGLMVAGRSWEEVDLLQALGDDLDVGSLGPTAIVIDDSHLAKASQRGLAQLAQFLPHNCRLLVASQHNPAFSVSKLRVSGLYTELRSADLAFSQAETDEMLTMAGLQLELTERERLQDLTEGWPAGLRLAVLAMQHADTPNEVIEAFETTPREVSDYLVNEVIDRVAPELIEFMTSISVLGEFDVALCRGVTEAEDAEHLMAKVIEQDLFIQESDRIGKWYHFHPMFNAFLQARLKSRDPGAFEKLHRRAVETSHERNDLAGSLKHATALGDLDLAAALVTESMSRGLELGDVREGRAVARAWLKRFGRQALEADPQRLLEVVLVLTSYGTREAERWLTRLGQKVELNELPPTVVALFHGAWADYLLNRGQVIRCLEHNHLAQSLLQEVEDPTRTFARFAELPLQEVGAHLLVGDLSAAGQALKESGPVPHSLIDDYRIPVLRSWLAFLEGDLAMARQGLRMLDNADTDPDAVAHGLGRIFTDLLKGGLHIEDGQLSNAARALARTAKATEFNGRPVIQSLVDVWLARLSTATRKHEAAVGALAHARLVLDQPDEAAQRQLDVETLRVALAFGTYETAHLGVPERAAGLTHVRVLLRQRSCDQAAAALHAYKPRNLRERIEWHVLRSLAELIRDPAGAHEELRLALELAEPHGYQSTILEQGHGVVSLLRAMPAEGTLRAYVDRLLLAAETASAPLSNRRTRLAVENLSERELTVLGLLSSRLTSQEIADTLFISPNTLKSHTKSVYRKLGVTTRADAARQAAVLDLL